MNEEKGKKKPLFLYISAPLIIISLSIAFIFQSFFMPGFLIAFILLLINLRNYVKRMWRGSNTTNEHGSTNTQEKKEEKEMIIDFRIRDQERKREGE